MQLFGQETASPEIRNIHAEIRDDSVVCSFAAPQLFSGKIKQTLLSGLPVLIERRAQLVKEAGDNSVFPVEKYRLTYDIWEDQYRVEGASKTTVFSSLTALEDWWNPRKNVPLTPVSQLNNGDVYKIDIFLRIILLTRSQGEKLKNWILNPQETEENFPSLERDAGFKLNLNQLVSFFFSKSDVIESFEARRVSDSFTIDELQKSGKRVKQN